MQFPVSLGQTALSGTSEPVYTTRLIENKPIMKIKMSYFVNIFGDSFHIF